MKHAPDPEIRLTRGMLLNDAIEIGHASKFGDIIAVELDSQPEPFLLGMVTKDGDCFEVQQHSGLSLDNLFFEFNDGDEVVLVHPFQPVTNGSSTFVLDREEELAVPVPLTVFGLAILCWTSPSRG